VAEGRDGRARRGDGQGRVDIRAAEYLPCSGGERAAGNLSDRAADRDRGVAHLDRACVVQGLGDGQATGTGFVDRALVDDGAGADEALGRGARDVDGALAADGQGVGTEVERAAGPAEEVALQVDGGATGADVQGPAPEEHGAGP